MLSVNVFKCYFMSESLWRKAFYDSSEYGTWVVWLWTYKYTKLYDNWKRTVLTSFLYLYTDTMPIYIRTNRESSFQTKDGGEIWLLGLSDNSYWKYPTRPCFKASFGICQILSINILKYFIKIYKLQSFGANLTFQTRMVLNCLFKINKITR